jgi:hypothetical protein
VPVATRSTATDSSVHTTITVRCRRALRVAEILAISCCWASAGRVARRVSTAPGDGGG